MTEGEMIISLGKECYFGYEYNRLEFWPHVEVRIKQILACVLGFRKYLTVLGFQKLVTYLRIEYVG